MIDGRLRAAVCCVTNRSSNVILNPEDADTKTGRPVIDVLCDKHPEFNQIERKKAVVEEMQAGAPKKTIKRLERIG